MDQPMGMGGRTLNKAEYENLDQNTRNEISKARHQGILTTAENIIYQALMTALAVQAPGPSGAMEPVCKLEDLIVVAMNRDEQIVVEQLPQLRDKWVRESLQVGIFVGKREDFAKAIGQWVPNSGGAPPYAQASYAISQRPPEGTVYMSVFDGGMCTVIFVAFDPNAAATPAAPATPAIPSAT